jgi:hypothetical protein
MNLFHPLQCVWNCRLILMAGVFVFFGLTNSSGHGLVGQVYGPNVCSEPVRGLLYSTSSQLMRESPSDTTEALYMVAG